MIEESGAGSGSVPLTNGSGSGSMRPKNIRIRRIRIRIRNTVCNGYLYLAFLHIFTMRTRLVPWTEILKFKVKKLQKSLI
jgi:hypothetical protein